MFLWLANGMAVVHGALVTVVALGALAAMLGLLRKRPRWEHLYYGLLALVIAANLLWGECPLTRWEQGLRNINRPGSAYCNSFIGHYLPLPPRMLAWLGPALIGSALIAAPCGVWPTGAEQGRRFRNAKKSSSSVKPLPNYLLMLRQDVRGSNVRGDKSLSRLSSRPKDVYKGARGIYPLAWYCTWCCVTSVTYVTPIRAR